MCIIYAGFRRLEYLDKSDKEEVEEEEKKDAVRRPINLTLQSLCGML